MMELTIYRPGLRSLPESAEGDRSGGGAEPRGLGNDAENRIGAVPFSVISRITSLLMLEDDDLVTAALDFLYQYTTLEENVGRLLAPPHGIELVKHLVRLLLFHGITGEQLVYIKATRKRPPPVYEIPFLPNEIVQDLFRVLEPERATKWMRCCFGRNGISDRKAHV